MRKSLRIEAQYDFLSFLRRNPCPRNSAMPIDTSLFFEAHDTCALHTHVLVRYLEFRPSCMCACIEVGGCRLVDHRCKEGIYLVDPSVLFVKGFYRRLSPWRDLIYGDNSAQTIEFVTRSTGSTPNMSHHEKDTMG